MVRIGSVWDATTDVLAGRAGLLAPLAGLAFLLPSIVQAAIRAYGGATVGAAALGGLVSLLALGAQLWGQLATVAIASDPSTTTAEAGLAARRRLPAALLVTLVLIAAGIVAVAPIVAALVAGGIDVDQLAKGKLVVPDLSSGGVLFLRLYLVLLLAAGAWATARLVPLLAVVLLERRRIGAIGRAVQVTRGLTGKLIGVMLLFGIAFLVATWAARSVVFVVSRLLLGADAENTATFLGAVAVALVNAAFVVVMSVFAARLYAAAVDKVASPA